MAKSEKRVPTEQELAKRKEIEGKIKSIGEGMKPSLEQIKNLQLELKALPKPVEPKKSKAKTSWLENKAKSAIAKASKTMTPDEKKKDLESVTKALKSAVDKKTFDDEALMKVALKAIEWASRQPEPVKKKAEAKPEEKPIPAQ